METTNQEPTRHTKQSTPNRHGDLKQDLHDLSDVAHDAVNVAKDGAKVIMDKAQEEVKSLKENSEKYVGEATTYIKENPGKSLLMAAVGGLILGLLLKK